MRGVFMTAPAITLAHMENGRTLISRWFSDLAIKSAVAMGSPLAFVLATLSVVVWALAGPVFAYSDTWQLVINTATTVLTFLAVFLIQHSQNRDGRAIQLKLDELIHASESARNRLIDLENCTEEEMEALHREFKRIQRSPTAETTGGSSKLESSP